MAEKSRKPRLRFKGFTETWEQRELGDIFKYEQPQPYIVESTEYQDSYSIPVLTAGQSFILGYTNEESGIKNASSVNPVVIFDDFTTSSHYVDFPFKVKSSAMKLLSLADKSDNIIFCFTALQKIDYVPVSHERHWISTFSKFEVLCPSKAEQNFLGNIFRKIDNLITLHQRKYDKFVAIKKALLEKMFPRDGKSVPEIRFKGFTETWEQRKLGETVAIVMGQSPDGSTYSDKQSDYILVQGNADLENGWVKPRVWTTQKTKLGSAGDLIMSVRAPAGSMGKTRFDVVLGRGVAAIKGNEFIFQLLVKKDIDGYWKRLSAGSTFESLNSDTIYNADIVIPEQEEQKKIGELFGNLDNLITLHQQQLERLKNIKSALLEKMFV